MSDPNEIELKYLANIPSDPEAIIELLRQCVNELIESRVEFIDLQESATEYETALEQDKANLEEQVSEYEHNVQDLVSKIAKLESLRLEQKKEIKDLEELLE